MSEDEYKFILNNYYIEQMKKLNVPEDEWEFLN